MDEPFLEQLDALASDPIVDSGQHLSSQRIFDAQLAWPARSRRYSKVWRRSSRQQQDGPSRQSTASSRPSVRPVARRFSSSSRKRASHLVGRPVVVEEAVASEDEGTVDAIVSTPASSSWSRWVPKKETVSVAVAKKKTKRELSEAPRTPKMRRRPGQALELPELRLTASLEVVVVPESGAAASAVQELTPTTELDTLSDSGCDEEAATVPQTPEGLRVPTTPKTSPPPVSRPASSRSGGCGSAALAEKASATKKVLEGSSDSCQDSRRRACEQGLTPVAARQGLRLPLYFEPPEIGLSLAAFEAAVAKRLRLILARSGEPDTAVAPPDPVPPPPAGDQQLEQGRKDDRMRQGSTEEWQDAGEDAAAHFLLRAAFASPPAMAERFITCEMALLERRWCVLSDHDREAAAAAEGLRTVRTPDGRTCCEVFFTDVPPALIAKRRVHLCRGIAQVPLEEASGIMAKRLEARLQTSMAAVAANAEAFQRHASVDDMIRRLRASADKLLPCKEEEVRKAVVIVTGPDRLSAASFEESLRLSIPPCMRSMILSQRAGRHLKHLGRLQLRSFQREAGLTLGEALVWWRTELARDPETPAECFDRRYRYDIEHSWGTRGHMRGSFAFSCEKILESPDPMKGQVHGCPFKLLPTQRLAQELAMWGAPAADVPKIVDAAVRAGPQAACARFFQSLHASPRACVGCPTSGQTEVRHPNAFFRDSRRVLRLVSSGLRRERAPTWQQAARASEGRRAIA